jgi:hypothetical protein
LKLVVSDDFQFNNPYKLELLTRQGTVRFISSEKDAGKLHAKVFVVQRKDGTKWIMVGSANLTGGGLVDNQEACIILDSEDNREDTLAKEIEVWIDQVFGASLELDFELAKRIFDTRAKYRTQRITVGLAAKADSVDSRRYWVLKATEGSDGDPYWNDFQGEDVVAIGWSNLDVDPSAANSRELRKAVGRMYPRDERSSYKVGRVAQKIETFVGMRNDDLALICRGYPPNSRADVHIHGIARIAGPFFDDQGSSWWRFKHQATIQVIDQKVPHAAFVAAVEKSSLMEAIHELGPRQFEQVLGILSERLGIQLTI